MRSIEVIKAFRALEDKWVNNDTKYMFYSGDRPETLYICNPEFPPMKWDIVEQKWTELQMKFGSFFDGERGVNS